MLRLDKVSKYYSSGGVVSTGFSKVSLELERGEFVAITGESGSGKSTLLNVISGLDTYEEGEMYIDGHPTSGYTTEEMEEYRKKYIVNIFQTFNLVNSYTVYQNVELVMLVNGVGKEEIRKKADALIERVGLAEYRNAKASKLSGGQKQRVAIARALAMDSPVIVADEPTGNLDTQSAADVLELLHELSKDKLVVVVTHNYEQIEQYVTRKITMNDGRIVEDRKISESERVEESRIADPGSLKTGSLVKLGVRNTFNIPAKFILLFFVFLFLCTGTSALYASVQNMGNESENGWNQYFNDISRERILVTKDDRTEFTKEDYEKLKAVSNVERVVKNDLSMDATYSLQDKDGNYYMNIQIRNSSEFKDRLKKGRMPEKASEAVLFIPETGYGSMIIDDVLKNKARIYDNNGAPFLNEGIKITGYGYVTEDEEEKMYTTSYIEAYLCMNSDAMKEMRFHQLQQYCTHEIEFDGMAVKGGMDSYVIMPSDKVPEGKVYIPEEISSLSAKWPVGQTLKIKNKSLYFTDRYEFTVGAVYTSENLNYYLARKDFDEISGSIFINTKEYGRMYDKGNFQSSVLIKDKNLADTTASEIEGLGFKTFKVHDGLVSYSEGLDALLNVLRIALLVAGVTVLFFVSYFITKLVLRSRNTYYSTVRMLGGTRENCRGLLRTDLFAVFNIAFAVLLAVLVLIKEKVILDGSYVSQMVTFLDPLDFVILYVLLALVSLLLAGRYSKQLFKDSAMNAYKEVA